MKCLISIIVCSKAVPYSRDYKRKYEFFRKKLKKQVSDLVIPYKNVRNLFQYKLNRPDYPKLTPFQEQHMGAEKQSVQAADSFPHRELSDGVNPMCLTSPS